MLKKKIWGHYETLRCIIGFYIGAFVCGLPIALGLSYIVHGSKIEKGLQSSLKATMLSGLMWFGIVMLVITLYYALRFLYSCDTITFTESGIRHSSAGFSKKVRIIEYEEITQVVFCDGLWWRKGEYYRGRKILFYNKNNLIFAPEIYPELCLSIMLILPEKVWLVNDKCNLSRVGNYFKIDFMGLSRDQQLAILKHYWKGKKYKTGDEILKKVI